MPDEPHHPESPAPAADAERRAFMRLLDTLRALRAPDGCPWDREQTLETMTPYVLEEAYEVIDAVASGDDDALAEELGDLGFLLFFCIEIARAEGRFDVEAVLSRAVDKLVTRHPHVFADGEALETPGVRRQWEAIKRAERAQGPKSTPGAPSIFERRLPAVPALTGAYRLQERAAAVGFDWPSIEPMLAKVSEELAELRAAIDGGDPRAARHELGDLLFAVVNVARGVTADPEAALRGTMSRFIARFQHIENRLGDQGRTPDDASLEEMDALWNEAKRLETGTED